MNNHFFPFLAAATLLLSALACSVKPEVPADEQYLLESEIAGVSTVSYSTEDNVNYSSIMTILTEEAATRLAGYSYGSTITLKGNKKSLTLQYAAPGTLPADDQYVYSMGTIIGNARHYDEIMDVVGQKPSAGSGIVYDVEEADFSSAYRAKLADLLDQYKDEQQSAAFESIFQAWGRYLCKPEVALQSNSESFKADDSYRDLVAFCQGEGILPTLLVIDKLVNGHFVSGFLLDDIIPESLQYLKDEAYHHYQEGMETIPSTLGNMYRLAQGYLDQVR